MTDASKAVAVIIPARNAAAYLASCLAGVAREQAPGERVPIIVVDDASSDDTGHIAQAAGALALRTDGLGPAAARNAGARSTTAEILVFLDADTAPEPGWLEAMRTDVGVERKLNGV